MLSGPQLSLKRKIEPQMDGRYSKSCVEKFIQASEEGRYNTSNEHIDNHFVLSGGLVEFPMAFGNDNKGSWFRNGTVSGPGGIKVTGSSRSLAMSGNNTYEGGTTIDATGNAGLLIASYVVISAAYSATAPYHCPKSTLILQQGLAAIMAGESAGRYSFGTISLLAGNDPAASANAARMTRAQNEARALIPSEAQMQQMMSDVRDTASPWQRGHTLIMLAEYFLLTGDEDVLPAIEAYAVNIARNSSLFGTMGHIFATKNPDGSDNGPMGGVYGPVNNAGMPCYLGLILARECGISHPPITPAIKRMNRFFGYYVGKGAIPYGEKNHLGRRE
jgi:hypothetical protein